MVLNGRMSAVMLSQSLESRLTSLVEAGCKWVSATNSLAWMCILLTKAGMTQIIRLPFYLYFQASSRLEICAYAAVSWPSCSALDAEAWCGIAAVRAKSLIGPDIELSVMQRLMRISRK